MESQKLTTQDICKLIEVLAKDNEVFTNGSNDDLHTYYEIGNMNIMFLYGTVSCSYKGLNIFKDSKANPISSTIHRIIEEKNQKKEETVLKEILNIIHNDKETTNS